MESKSLITALECPTCLEIPEKGARIYQCVNGHIICELCYPRLRHCPCCRLKLGLLSCNSSGGAIRNLFAEKVIKESPVPEGRDLKRSKRKQFNQVYYDVIQMNKKLKLELVMQKTLDDSQYRFDVDGEGFTNVFVVANTEKIGIYWGKDTSNPRGNVIFTSGTMSSKKKGLPGSEVQAAIAAIARACGLGIEKLKINLNENQPAYGIINDLGVEGLKKVTDWKDIKEKFGENVCADLGLLASTLNAYSPLPVQFNGVKENIAERRKAYAHLNR